MKTHGFSGLGGRISVNYLINKNEYAKQYGRTPKGWLKKTYSKMKVRSKDRGVPLCISEPELMDFVFSKNADIFQSIYKGWVDSGFKRLLGPSIDRINNFIGYSPGNIQLVTVGENIAKSTSSQFVHLTSHMTLCELNKRLLSKTVEQRTLDGALVATHSSTNEAHRTTGYSQTRISQACRGVRKTYMKYLWNYTKPM